MYSRRLFLTILLSLVFSSLSYPLYDVSKSNVVNLNPKNFDTQITQTRSKNVVSFIHFYTRDDLKSNGYKEEIEKVSTEYDGMFKIAAIDCKEFKDLCEKQDVREYPQLKIYPPLPAPVFPYEGEIKHKTIVSSLGRFVENKTIEVHSGNVDSFIGDNANLPKVFLFMDKPGVPLIFKVLAVQFDKKMKFGIVRKEESSIISKYKINKFPRIMVLGVGAKKPDFFEGETKFKNVFDFINIYSETFFKVGEDKTKASETTKEDKPWLNEKLPELNEKSANDICFKVDGVICVIIANNEKPQGSLNEIVTELTNYLSPKIDYGGIKYKFSWVNPTTQKSFSEVTGISETPRVVLINPGKRKRFYVYEETANLDSLKTLFDKLASGDLRFKMFPGNEFPAMSE